MDASKWIYIRKASWYCIQVNDNSVSSCRNINSPWSIILRDIFKALAEMSTLLLIEVTSIIYAGRTSYIKTKVW